MHQGIAIQKTLIYDMRLFYSLQKKQIINVLDNFGYIFILLHNQDWYSIVNKLILNKWQN